MEQKRLKNFIAFTLSEMMIVLLIISVLSAVTLPNFVGRKSAKNIDTDSTWQYDYTYTFGDYYKGNTNNTQVIIGHNITDYDTDTRELYANSFGNSSVLLRRQHILPNATNSRSDIAFYNVNGVYQGKIAADAYGNMLIGKNFGNVSSLAQAQASYSNLLVGLSTNPTEATINTDGNSINNNTVLGINSLRNSNLEDNNIVIGNEINNANFEKSVVIGTSAANNKTARGSVILGSSASFDSSSLESINIGYYSNYASRADATLDMISIGAYANNLSESISGVKLGYKSGNNSFKSREDVVYIGNYAGYGAASILNIGSYAGFYRGSTFVSPQYPGINIGYYAGFNNKYAHLSAINIGSYSGQRNPSIYSTNSINIGYASGNMINYYGYNQNGNNISIGFKAGTESGRNNIFIGKYAGSAEGLLALNPSNPANGHGGSYNIDIGSKNVTSGSVYVPGVGSSFGVGASKDKDYNVIIGCAGITLSTDHRMCIGGKYPLSTNTLGNMWDTNGSTSGLNAATFITTPGILAASNVAWNKTKIVFITDYLVAKNATMSLFSDKTLKENIKKTKYGIEKFRKIAVKEFNMKGSKVPNIGVIAQELMKIYPNAVTEEKNMADGKKYYAVSPDWIIFSMVQALKDVDAEALNLYNELKENKKLLAKETKRVDSIESSLDKLSGSNKVLKSQLNEIDKVLKR